MALGYELSSKSIIEVREQLAVEWNLDTKDISYNIKCDKYDPHVSVIYTSNKGNRHTEYFKPDEQEEAHKFEHSISTLMH